MWLITQGTSGYQYPTCKEKETLTNPYYLIKFIQDTGKNERYCVCSDLSAYPERYQKFLITETNTPVSGNGEVKLDHLQSWKYYIYESATNNPINETGLNEVEQGRVKVLESNPTTLPRFRGYQSTYQEKQ